MSDLLSRALAFAFQAHAGQVRKYDAQPYIQHPIRVALRVARASRSDEMIAAAYSHDVVEDCGITHAEILARFGPVVSGYVRDLTDQFTKESHPKLNRAARKALEHERLGQVCNESKVIKLADLLDNLTSIDPNDGFAVLFCAEADHLLNEMGAADLTLYDEVLAAIRKLEYQINNKKNKEIT